MGNPILNIKLAIRELAQNGAPTRKLIEATKEAEAFLVSEDEKIRNGLIHHLQELREWKAGSMSPIKVKEHYDAWIAYLEKQKEQKPIFRVGDTMRTWDEAKRGIKDGLPHIISINSTDYLCNNEAIRISDQGDYEFPPMNRKQPAEWSEEDKETLACAISVFEDFAESKNVSVPPASAKRYLKRLKSFRPQPKAEWSDEDKNNLNRIAEILVEGSNVKSWWSKERLISTDEMQKLTNWLISIRPQQNVKWSEEDSVRLEEAIQMVESKGTWVRSDDAVKLVSNWLKSLRPQQKMEWSEEDEEIRRIIINRLTKFDEWASKQGYTRDDPGLRINPIDWFKSLRPNWKPSEEQMKALYEATNLLAYNGKETHPLRSLRKELQELL